MSHFIVSTADYAGLGLANRLQDEGHVVTLATNPACAIRERPEVWARYLHVGNDLVPKRALCELMRERESLRDAYWIWDSNHSPDESELLHREKFRILGGGRHSYRMEHDRQACLEFVGQYGLQAPPSWRFENPKECLNFCRDHSGTAFVYKPDSGDKYETFVPEAVDDTEANSELDLYLRSLRQENRRISPFLLQERKNGVETNVEVWFHDGRPLFAFMSLECKRRHVLDLGELTGCAFDYVFVIPLESRAVQETVGKLFPAYEHMKYTGFADANFIAAKDGVWFLEKCERFGYNSHPNLFWNLAKRGVGEILASFIDGTLEPDFAEGFGASVTMSTKESAPPGKAIQFPPKLAPDLYFYDVYRCGELLLTAGFDPDGDVLLVNGYGYTLPTAWEEVMKKAALVRFPYRSYRTDGDQTNFPSSPIRRYEALKAMAYI